MAPVDMRVCRRCVNGDAKHAILVTGTPPEIKNYSSWCSKAMCPCCANTWYICTKCTNIRSQIDTKQKLRTHGWRYHGKGLNKKDGPVTNRPEPTNKRKDGQVTNRPEPTNKRKEKNRDSERCNNQGLPMSSASSPTMQIRRRSGEPTKKRKDRKRNSERSHNKESSVSSTSSPTMHKSGESLRESEGSSSSKSEPIPKRIKNGTRLVYDKEEMGLTVTSPPSVVEVMVNNDINQHPYNDNMNLISKEETPSRLYGGCPSSIRACKFSRQESTDLQIE